MPPRATPQRVEPPPIPKQAIPTPVGTVRSGPIRRRPISDKVGIPSSADLIIEERPSNLNLSLDVLRVPARSLGIDPFAENAASPLTDVLFRCATSLAELLSLPHESDWPQLVVQHCTSLCDRLGILPRAQRELLLVARLHAILTLQLIDKGPLPPPRKDRLGFDCDAPLDGVLASLQSDFLDFLRLPQDDDPPLGVRLVSTVLEALRLAYLGHTDAALATQLRDRLGENDVVRTLLELYADQPPVFTERSTPPAHRPAKLPAPISPLSVAPLPTLPTLRIGWPKPATMPDVPWSCERVSTLPEDGLLPYPAPAKPEPPLPSG